MKVQQRLGKKGNDGGWVGVGVGVGFWLEGKVKKSLKVNTSRTMDAQMDATNATATSISTGQSLSVKLKIPHRVQPEFLPRPGLPGQYTNKLHYFKKHLLDEVVKKKFALDFMEPVDTVALQVPTYYTVIERPMDIGTIIKRVHNNYYRYVEEAISDFRLVLRNCFTFNCAGDVVYRKGQMLEKFFTKIIRGIPPGPEIPCHKDPRAMARPRGILKVTSAMIDMERECREQLNQLQHNSSLADTHARNFFNSKWESLHKKLDKHYFKSEEDFKSHVDAIFKKYYEGAKMIYENTYGRTSAQALGLVGAESSSAVIMLDAADVRTLCRTAELLENGLRYFVEVSKQKWETCTVKGLVDDFSDTINALRDRYEIQRFFGNQDSGVPCIAAHTMLREGELDFFSVPSDCEADFEEERHTFVGTDERRSVQKLFAMLPVQSMAEIVHIILQIEGFSMESNKHMNFDVQSFKQETLHLMKKSITRAVRATTKLNLRDMQPAEKDGLKRSLEQQLQDITKILNSGRAKKTIKAAARAKAQTDDGTPQMQRTATNYTRTLTDSSGSSESSDSSKTSESSASSSSSDSSESSSEEEEKSSVSSPAGSSQSNNAPSQDCVDGPNVSPLSQSMRSPMSTLSEQLMLSSTDISISSSQRSNCNSPDNCGESDNCSLPSSKAGSPPRTNELNLQFMSESDQHSIDRTLQLGQESMTTVSPPQINEHNSTSFAFKSDIPPLEKKSKTPESQYLTYESNQQALTPVSRLKPHIYQLDRAPITSTYGRNQQEFLTECSSQPSNYQLDQQIVMYGSPSQTYESNRKAPDQEPTKKSSKLSPVQESEQ
ncbi:uncharacterized protein LOC115627159 [Scaptodrosophila lebanonensis]|uniref:Uncharacterized protein LOC115627159 n=1 Tax=Drosophila lebanonensis TaxID=7225 RepID=A0A6J2TRH1_DROLE|nr:uncharacterized protein LOC115627159 [Scaptodrosophila lebanonensis]